MIRYLLAGLVGALIWFALTQLGAWSSGSALISWGLVAVVLAAMAGQAIGAYRRDQDNVQLSSRANLTTPKQSNSVKQSTPPVDPPVPDSKPVRSEAITLLATLQREARFVDLVQESLTEYSDAQVGAAARDVLRDCRSVLDRFFDLQPVVEQPEGTSVEIEARQSAGRIRMTGVDQTDPSNKDSSNWGSLVHHGWEARQCHVPMWSGSQELALLVVPAELEKK